MAEKRKPNPKQAFGNKKPPLHLLPLSGMIEQSLAHLDGDNKYSFENWNEDPIESLTYIGAAIRHIELYKYGERRTRDTKVHNLGAVMACCAIMIDAELNDTLIDNTRHSKAACDLLHQAEHVVAALNEMQKERDEEKALKLATFEELKAASPAFVVSRDTLRDICQDYIKPGNLVFIPNDAGGDAPAYVETEGFTAAEEPQACTPAPQKKYCDHCDEFVVAPCTLKALAIVCTNYAPPAVALKTCGRCKTTTECENSGYCRA